MTGGTGRLYVTMLLQLWQAVRRDSQAEPQDGGQGLPYAQNILTECPSCKPSRAVLHSPLIQAACQLLSSLSSSGNADPQQEQTLTSQGWKNSMCVPMPDSGHSAQDVQHRSLTFQKLSTKAPKCLLSFPRKELEGLPTLEMVHTGPRRPSDTKGIKELIPTSQLTNPR